MKYWKMPLVFIEVWKKIEPLNPMDAVAVQAMEDLLQYKALGTISEIIGQQYELQTYRAIGTVEEFKALKEKEKYCLGYLSENGIKSPQFD